MYMVLRVFWVNSAKILYNRPYSRGHIYRPFFMFSDRLIGRTPDFESGNSGSRPDPRSKPFRAKCVYVVVLVA